MHNLRAGICKIDITPPIGICQAGFGSRKGMPSIGIYDELYAKILVLERGKVRTAIVTTDTLGLDTELTSKIKKLIYRQTGIKDVLLSGSHTHSGPLIGPAWHMKSAKKDFAYIDILSRQIAGAVYAASNNMTAVRVKSGTGYAKIGINRRPVDKDGKVRKMGRNPRGVIDTDVPILVLERTDGNVLALLLTYACHAVTAGDSFYISADYPGYTQRLVENKLDCNVLFTQGAGANINPIGFPSKTPFRLAETLGEKLGRAVLLTLKKIKKYKINPCLMVTSKKILIPLREELFSEKVPVYLRGLREENVQRIKGKEFSYEIYVMRIGNCLFVGLEGEVLVEIGLEIKQKVFARHKGIKNVSIIGYAGNTSYYLSVPKTFEEGGYEYKESLLAKEASNMIINSVLRIVGNMWK
ncbi:MAG: neutral/alkaline non-lysosomal ceramidase N-terminal domain-containing protein [bacterium]